MVAKYCSKQEKFQEAKQRSAVEQRLVRELDGCGSALGNTGQMGQGQPSPPSNIA